MTTALIAEDEPRLREELRDLLAISWPALQVVAMARNGLEAVEQFDALRPEICFLDVNMPRMDGVEAARRIGQRAHLVFVTAYEQYAVQAFAQGVLDYLVKPVELRRLEETVARLQVRLRQAAPSVHNDEFLSQLAAQLQHHRAPSYLRWLHAQVGTAVRLIPVERIDYLQADHKYTLVAWRNDDGKPAEALVGLSLKELLAQLDPQRFVQVHRSAIVSLAAISHVVRADHETAEIHLKGRVNVLRLSRSFNHLFRQM